ncbi:hypothetical protein ACLI4Z_06545 [Natrialbaceae archaeon A-arb3/5]
MEDIEHAHDAAPMSLWGAISSAVVSLSLPIVGLVAAYRGYRLTDEMHCAWFGLLFAAIGAAMVVTWITGLVLWQLGYISV